MELTAALRRIVLAVVLAALMLVSTQSVALADCMGVGSGTVCPK